MPEILTNELELQQEETQRDKYLTFIVEKEYYGIEIRYVTEIIGIQSITEVPDLPKYIRGIINLRGKIIPVMDVRLRFGKEFREYDDRTCIIVIDVDNMFVGLIVDSVCEVMSIPDGEIVVPPDFDQSENKFIKGIGKTGNEVRLILDCEKLLKD
ncbi:purine-binding chemotaxis protein CheW [Acetivibrio thermocellus AD2]|mgnify:FL=1|jgi:purine-binding chemotaxis protein CheW|uniref:Purine-binding chemotaxis protein CheW n=1 Tax=Acetivibrio thermocellus AD2 TaxID=1138384 RepID=A0AB36TIR0_ACETH|nr:chemotaxis protein CheW [Acetivibrio thermocellus]ADU75236.1 CheW protein [Acetivibrio thermocellus DSM 1313]ALX09211.1 CheW protein [Acetivibrio thermocellus AD2]ANV76963.1 CheW protein [Acetivibrio thermocellus DSM 2360]EIC04786.1 CheW domain protein [Acetivibrio thermocellus YS]PFH03486.1 purine-binding chemotaxis protein CheW [Acetivibrio thermocellus AD2]